MKYQWSSITGEVKFKESPLRKHLDRRFPNTLPLSTQYRTEAGDLKVDLGSLPQRSSGTLGSAYDYYVRFELDSSYAPVAAILPTVTDFESHHDVVLRLVDTARATPGETRLAACWALALWTEITRIGTRALEFDTPLADLRDGHQFSLEEHLAFLPHGVHNQLADLVTLTEERLFPHLNRSDLLLGPTFAGSRLCTGDADLISAGLLVDLKTRLGPLNPRTGVRHDQMKNTEIYQVLCYALWDFDDEFALKNVAIYSSRYGALHRWALKDFMGTMAMRDVDLAEERSLVRHLLENPPDE